MTTRTRTGSLQLTDTFTSDRTLIIRPGAVTLGFLVVDRDSDQRAEIALGAAGLDALQAEITRLREELDI